MAILLPGASFPTPPEKFPIYARSGWKIPAVFLEKQRTQAEMEIKTHEFKKWRPQVTVRSTAIYPYNCVGMIFASRRAWIEIDYIYRILREDGYREISKGDVMTGDVIVYTLNGDPVHVGLVSQVSRPHPSSSALDIFVLSKWGLEAEMFHYFDDVPFYLGIPSRYYTERT